MKRILALLLIFTVLYCGNTFAVGNIKTFESINSTGGYQLNKVDTNLIRPNREKILGWCIIPYNLTLNSERVAGLYDTIKNYDGLGNTMVECIAETETDVNSGAQWFAHGLVIETQLWIWQGPNTAVLIYYATR